MKRRFERIFENMLSTSEVASVLGLSTRTLFRMLATERIPEPARDPKSRYYRWRPEEVGLIHQEILRKRA